VTILNTPLWHTTSLLSEDSTFGDIAHSFFGYSDAPTAAQLGVYVLYLATALVFFLRSRPSSAAVSSSAPGSHPAVSGRSSH
jgi:high-affinity iron transporter